MSLLAYEIKATIYVKSVITIQLCNFIKSFSRASVEKAKCALCTHVLCEVLHKTKTMRNTKQKVISWKKKMKRKVKMKAKTESDEKEKGKS